ncbi:response regulator transcription factor [Terrilactibacillus sp. S3-3]|nr:response regulator transcription factor [Terrilactibacillus sp. S3-3]
MLVIDDHAMVTYGTKAVLEKEGFDVDTLPGATRLQAVLKNKRYDLYLVDLNMPDIDGTEAMEQILSNDPDAKVLIYTGYDTEIKLLFVYMITKGASGVISKSASIETLIASLKAALRDEVILPISLFRQLGTEEAASPSEVELNDKEYQIMVGVMDGKTNKEIAEWLLISQRTVEKYLTSIFQKLGVHSRVGALNKAKKLGILPHDKRNGQLFTK